MTRNQTRTSSTARAALDPLHCEPDEVIHVGVDVHKATYHVALVSDRRGLLTTWSNPYTRICSWNDSRRSASTSPMMAKMLAILSHAGSNISTANLEPWNSTMSQSIIQLLTAWSSFPRAGVRQRIKLPHLGGRS